MASVKESRQHRMVVVRHRPILKWSIRGFTVLALAATGAGAYHYGYQQGAGQLALLEKMLAENIAKVTTLEASNSEYAQQLINTKTGAEVDRKSSEAVRQEVLELKTALQKIQEENNFYRNIMSPEKGGKGPAIGEWELTKADEAGHYHFKLVVKQLAKHTNWVKGHVSITIEGQQNNSNKSYNYSEIAIIENSDNDKAKNDATKLKVKFRYFQTLAGELALPKDFAPEKVIIQLNMTDPKNTTITQNYDWLAH